MRLSVLACGLGALGLVGLVFAEPAAAAKTKLGCERGKEVWDASVGKCVAKTAKAAKKKTAAKKAPAKK